MTRPTLFEFAGGSPAFEALAAAHHARCLADPELNHPFSHPDQHPQHVQRLAAYWAEVLGGPASYSASCGDQSGVLQMHSGNGDMGDLGERFVRCFDLAIDDADAAGGPRVPCRAARVHALGGRRRADVLAGRRGRACGGGDAAVGVGRAAGVAARAYPLALPIGDSALVSQ